MISRFTERAICLEERSLAELLAPRLEIERRFARQGHSDRHGRLYRSIERNLTTPALKLALQLGGVYAAGVHNALSPVVKHVRLAFDDLPAAFDGFQILHLTDFHIDGTHGLAEALVPVLESLRPDLCVFTGDYRFHDHGPWEPVIPPMNQVIAAIQAKHGIFGILGNHDVSELAFALEDAGVRMLLNESVAIREGSSELFLIGVDDPFDYRCDDLPRARRGVPKSAFQVLLAHAPELYLESEAAGIDLYLAGHTHGGQIRLPGIGAVRQNARCPRAYTYGYWRHGRLQGYTSSGVGCSTLPVRFNCPPELIMIELIRER